MPSSSPWATRCRCCCCCSSALCNVGHAKFHNLDLECACCSWLFVRLCQLPRHCCVSMLGPRGTSPVLGPTQNSSPASLMMSICDVQNMSKKSTNTTLLHHTTLVMLIWSGCSNVAALPQDFVLPGDQPSTHGSVANVPYRPGLGDAGHAAALGCYVDSNSTVRDSQQFNAVHVCHLDVRTYIRDPLRWV